MCTDLLTELEDFVDRFNVEVTPTGDASYDNGRAAERMSLMEGLEDLILQHRSALGEDEEEG